MRITFDVEAEAEVDAAFHWYWKQSADAAVAFLDELAEMHARICRNPRLFPFVKQPLRKAVLPTYPYYLLFRENQAGIQILVVAHAKRRPGYWKGRG